MKKPSNWNSLIDSFDDCNCPYAYIVSYYLSRFDKDAYQKLGFGNITETHQKIGSILKISPNTIKNFRDAFDPYHSNRRKGWWQRKLWRFEKEIYRGFKDYTEQEMYGLICKILKNPEQDFQIFFFEEFILDDKFILPDEEITEEKEIKAFLEGSLVEVKLNAYERNNKARQKCIEYHGTDCVICGFNFEKMFGNIGKNFIHVHHLIPLSQIHEKYEVDPLKDLRPVCPNCHAMIHKKNPPFTIEEMKKILSINH